MILDPDPAAPALKVADIPLVGHFEDETLLRRLRDQCPAITTEFENVPSDTLAWFEQDRIVRPSSRAVATCQDRISEKTFLRDHGFRTAPFLTIGPDTGFLPDDADRIFPAILKASREGYDGKGQWPVSTSADLALILRDRPGRYILEQKLSLLAELSIIVVRSASGEMALYPVVENIHESGILHFSIVPARVPPAVSSRARDLALEIVRTLDYVGVLAVEFFLDSSGTLSVNELAPRPHNSGHFTLDACAASQFDQHVRVLAGLPPASTELLSPAVMGNLLGHLWEGGPPSFDALLACPGVRLTLYGKEKARYGRKMGHFTLLDADPTRALSQSRTLLENLATKTSSPVISAFG